MTLDEIIRELRDEADQTVIALVVTSAGGTPTRTRTMATAATGLDLLAAAGALLDTVQTRAEADDGAASTEVAAQVDLAVVHLGHAVDALLGMQAGEQQQIGRA